MPPPRPRSRQEPSGGLGGSSGLEKQRFPAVGGGRVEGKDHDNVEGNSKNAEEEEGKKKRKRSRPKKKG